MDKLQEEKINIYEEIEKSLRRIIKEAEEE